MFLRLNVRQIILLFSEDLSATQIFHLTKIPRPAVNKYLTAIRLRILELSLLQSDPLVGQIEVDESYFGAQCARGARGKTIVFGLLKRGDKVYTEIVPNCKRVLLYKRLSRVRRTLIVLFIQMVGVGIMV